MKTDLFNSKVKNREYWNGQIKLMIVVIRESEKINDINYQLQAKACRSQLSKDWASRKDYNNYQGNEYDYKYRC